jgi:hypothetical protein
MEKRNMRDKNRRGELAEATFMVRAMQSGWIVFRPFAEKQCYDSSVDNSRDRRCVQVKSAEVSSSQSRYHINLGPRRQLAHCLHKIGT